MSWLVLASMRCLPALALLAWGAAGGTVAWAQAPAAGVQAAKPAERSLSDWLMRLHDASRRRSYIGTFVVSSASGAMSSARIWHVCDGEQQMERVEALSGTPRMTFRRNDQVVTFLPEAKVARIEKQESASLFPNLLSTVDPAIVEFYGVRQQGSERVAGFDADVVLLLPKDAWRFGYRIWSEKKTGLAVKLQTLDTDGRVLEQAAFSELQFDAPVRMDKLAQMMGQTEGYRVEKAEQVRTTPAAEGWALKAQVPGFKSMSCWRRAAAGAAEAVLQWVFSDGLASVSLFVEPYDRQRHGAEGVMAMGATHTLTRRLSDKGGEWWLTAVGEVPQATLKAFAQGLERRK